MTDLFNHQIMLPLSNRHHLKSSVKYRYSNMYLSTALKYKPGHTDTNMYYSNKAVATAGAAQVDRHLICVMSMLSSAG